MSAETLSGAIATPATSIGIESSGHSIPTPSFGGRIDGGFSAINSSLSNINVGGVNNPDLNNSNIFSHASELNIGSVETFDKVVHGNLAFTHTEILWQASEKPAIEPISLVGVTPIELTRPINTELPSMSELENVLGVFKSRDISKIQEQEIAEGKMSESAEEVLDSYLSSLDLRESGTEELIDNKEVIADAEQGAIAKDAWIAIGASEADATESVTNALNEKLQRIDYAENLIAENQIKYETEEDSVVIHEENLSDITQEKTVEENTDDQEKAEPVKSVKPNPQIQEEQVSENDENIMNQPEMSFPPQPEEYFFEEDPNADKARKEIAKKAVERASEKVSKDENREINGAEIAEEMPRNPQPNEVISEIIKESKKHDGSYVEMTKQIAGSGEIETPDAAKQIIEKAIQENPAVRITSIKTSRPVTKEDVQKVLGEGKEVPLFNKS